MEEIMLQDIAPQKLCNQYDASIHPKDEDIVFCFYGKEVLLAQGGLPTKKILFQTFGEELQAYGEFIFLFKIDEMSFFLSTAKDVLRTSIIDSKVELINKIKDSYFS